ncbi:DUF3152 domain-containing protein [Micromonospora sp. ALFpr18c]|uniref:DUF3152 domain-containing protein n=1 Tax=unclassified Micromonospora TaxID=2617518 RepID=UPI00124B6FA5|nr:DUF3152 domain-containing protein [Micromonospora sp. ALFpr18c]KAB1923932.1 DUF3152 domain-containing protein [Micromonospora sp. ALFpr18c]
MSTKVTRRGRAASAALLLVVALLTGCGLPAGGGPATDPSVAGPTTSGLTHGEQPAAGQGATGRPAAAASAGTAPTPIVISYPATGGNRWSVAAAETTAGGGSAGQLLRYRIAVERDIRGLPVADVAAAVSATLNDPRGWTAGGTWRLRRVGANAAADFTIYLATPGTRDTLCQGVPDGYTSCRNGDRVVLNVARWVKAVPGYGANLATYRQYVVNHEVGHRLGLGHERCPRRGRPAPVMQQQTLGLHGCTANAWPYPLGTSRYTGPVGAYLDEVPPREAARPAH